MEKEEFRNLTPIDPQLSREERINAGPIAPPEARIPAKMAAILKKHKNAPSYKNLFFDVHAHCFTTNHLPEQKLWKVMARYFKETEKAVQNLKGASRVGKYFQDSIKGESARAVDLLLFEYKKMFKNNLNIDAPDIILVQLMMDFRMQYTKEEYEDTKLFYVQMKEMHELRGKRGDQADDFNEVMLPFFAVDPNNPNMFEDFLAAFCVNTPPEAKTSDNAFLDGQPPFFGVKLYPTLGYLPSNPKLMEIFRLCEAFEIPVLTHCGGGRTRHRDDEFETQTRHDYIPGRVTAPTFRKISLALFGKKQRGEESARIFCSPKNWEDVLQNYPKLKVNLAHLGSIEQWKEYRKNPNDLDNHVKQSLDIISTKKNFYADISYTYSIKKNKDKIRELLKSPEIKKELENKILYGSDFCLTYKEKKEPIQIVAELFDKRKGFGEDMMDRFAHQNPIDYLFNPPK